MLTIGCHLSSSKGYLAMGKEAVNINANTFQFFTRNPRGGNAKELNPADINAFLTYAEEHNICKILAHAPYTLNACPAEPWRMICAGWNSRPATVIIFIPEAT